MEENLKRIRKILDEMEYINGKVNLFDEVWDLINCYDEEYAHEQGIDILDNEDVYNIVSDILDNNEIQEIIMAEIESHAGYKKNRMIEEV